MNRFSDRAFELRKDIIAYIEDYLVKANRSIIVEKDNVTYLDWDSATFQAKTKRQVVPEVEITMITLAANNNYGTMVRFVDGNGNEVLPSQLDTEELLYVVDYLDYLDMKEAPDCE